jgi:hypothetical protein
MPTYPGTYGGFGAPMADLTGLSARVAAPSPVPYWLVPPYNFASSITLSAGSVSTVYIPPQTISVRSFEYWSPSQYAAGFRPKIIYGSGSSGAGGSDVAGVTYINNVWTVYNNSGQIVNTKTIVDSLFTVSKAPGVADGWVTGSGLPGNPSMLFIEF